MSDITRTKVLEILEHNWTSLHNPDYTDEELGKALDFCISSLETDEAYDFMYEQPEWCKDCISREQAIKEFCKQTCETPNCRFRDKGIAHASCDEVDVLKRLPSVLPKATKNDLGVASGLEKNSKKLENPTTKDNLGVDCISRKAVLNTLDNMDSALDDEDRTVETYKELLKECYKVLPSVTPIRPKGHWIEQIDHEENCRTLICSNCDRPALHDGDSIWKHKFCPHCGADMRGEEE